MKRRNFFASLLGSLLLTVPLMAAQAKSTELTLSYWIPAAHPLITDFIAPWSEQIEEKTDGRVKVRLLTKPVTNPQGHFDAVRDGLTDLTFISHSHYPGRFGLTHFAVFPFSGDTATSRSIAAWKTYEKHLLDQDEHRGVKLLGIFTHGPGALYTTSKKVESPDDLEGLKVRVGGGMAAEVGKALGASIVAKPAPESYELLSTGVVDGVFFPPESVPGFKLESLVKHALVVPGGLYSDSFAIIMNQDAFNSLSEEDQKAIESISGEYLAAMAGKTWDKYDALATEMLQDDVETVVADEAFIDVLKERTQPIRDQWLQAMEEKGLDGPAVLEEFQNEITAIDKANQ